MALGLCRPPIEVEVGSTQEATTARVCALVDSLLSVAFVGLSAPPDATPEEFRAVTRVNARLAQMGETFRGSEPMRELGC